MNQFREMTARLLERSFTRREFLLYAAAVVPVLIGINGFLKKLLEVGHHGSRTPINPAGKNYGGRVYGK